METVTIGLPAYNNEDTVLDAVRSVFAQSHQNWRLIAIDDGSSDRTLELLNAIDDPRVEVVSDGNNRGLAARLNELAALAETPLLARMDADDLMHPDRLSHQVQVMARAPWIDFVSTSAYTIDESTEITGLLRTARNPSVLDHLAGGPYLHPSVLGRTEWFRANPYDESLGRAEDQDLWLRTLATRKTLVMADALLFYRDAGVVTTEKYVRSMNVTEDVIRRHSSLVSSRQRAQLLAQCELKKAVYRAYGAVGDVRKIVERRGTPLSDAERRYAQETLSAVREQRIPGID